MARLLLISDAGAHSGFATVAHSIFERLVADYGYDVSVIAANYRGDFWPTNLKLYMPPQGDIYGQSRFIELVGKLMPEAIIFINDPAVVMNALLNNSFDPDRVLWRGIQNGDATYRPPILAYLPVDGYGNPRSWDVLSQRVTRIAMSKFGQEAMPEAPVVWHGVDTAIFKPRDKREAKAALGFDPDRFLVLRVDKNSIRKDYPSTWKALRPVLRAHPDIDVHFHCLPISNDGYNLHAVAWNDEDIRDRLTFSPDIGGFTGWSTENLATLYAAADVFVSTSWGEGFGLTLLEAMACGTPVVATDCSAITEVVGPGGILVPSSRRISMPMGQDQCLPYIEGFTAAIDKLYRRPALRAQLAVAALAQAQTLSWDIAASLMNKHITAAIAAAIP